MNVLFLEFEMERDWAVASIGPAFLASIARANGHHIDIIHVSIDETAEQLSTKIIEKAPDVLGLSLTSRQWLRAKTFINHFRKESFIPTISGGLHPTFAPEAVLEEPGFDYVCLGEGEGAFVDFLETLAIQGYVSDGQIDNIWVKDGHRPKLRPPYDPIDQLPFMARDMLNEQHGVINMTTQRGCPFPCTYCAARMYNEIYTGYGRRRSIDNVLHELRQIRDTGELNYIIFLDDTFTINHKWVREFCKVYPKEIGVAFSLHARVETINKDMLHSLAEAGCAHITFGVESGSERVRREVMDRKVTNQRLIAAFEWSKSAGILTTANYIIGIPTETIEDLEATIKLHHQLQPDDFGYFVFYPYPGTPMYHYCKRNGLLPDDFDERPANHRQSVLLHDTLSPDEIEKYYNRFTQIREADYLNKYGIQLNGSGQADVHEQIEHIACTG
ncbi:MAG: B12-binding domain-containing radical SAM protein [Myxococcota bacterium]